MVISFLRENLKLEFVDLEEFYKPIQAGFDNIKIPRIFYEAVEASPKYLSGSKTCYTIAYAHTLARNLNIKYFLTSDIEDFEKLKEPIKQFLGLELAVIRQQIKP